MYAISTLPLIDCHWFSQSVKQVWYTKTWLIVKKEHISFMFTQVTVNILEFYYSLLYTPKPLDVGTTSLKTHFSDPLSVLCNLRKLMCIRDLVPGGYKSLAIWYRGYEITGSTKSLGVPNHCVRAPTKSGKERLIQWLLECSFYSSHNTWGLNGHWCERVIRGKAGTLLPLSRLCQSGDFTWALCGLSSVRRGKSVGACHIPKKQLSNWPVNIIIQDDCHLCYTFAGFNALCADIYKKD